MYSTHVLINVILTGSASTRIHSWFCVFSSRLAFTEGLLYTRRCATPWEIQ